MTQDFHGATRTAVDSWDISKFLDVAAINPYHDTQERLDGWWIAFMGDFTRSMKKAPYLVTETNAQTIGWDAKGQYPPFDGQLRLQAWSHVANGAHMVEYWHWHSLHYGQETYWKGLLGHDLEPNRVYEEATRIGAEFKRVGPQLAGHDAEEPRGHPAQRRLALGPHRSCRWATTAATSAGGRRPTTWPSRTSCTRPSTS